mgnify:CR=1 FL=1
MSESVAFIAAMLTWAIVGLAITHAILGHFAAEQPLVPGLVIVVGVCASAAAPAALVYTLAK